MKRSFNKKVIRKVCIMGAVIGLGAFQAGCGLIKYPGCVFLGYDNKQENTQSEDYTKEESSLEESVANDGTSAEVTEMESNSIDVSDETGSISYNHYFYNFTVDGLNSVVTPEQTKYLAKSSETDNFDRRITYGEYVPIPVCLTDEKLSDFLAELKKIEVEYQYSDLYYIDNALAEAAKYDNEYPVYSDFICDTDKIPTFDLLYDVISKNSKEYLSSHPGLTALSDEQLKVFVNLLYDDLLLYKDYLSEESLQRVYSGLKDIKVACIDSTDFQLNDLKKVYNARVLEDFTFLFDYNSMDMLRGEQIVERTMDHEINHIFQRMCPDNQIDGYDQIGGSQYFRKLEENHMPNSVHFQWLYEAAAEELVSDKYDLDPLVYTKMIGYLHSLDLIALLSEKYDENAFEIASLNTDRDSFYELLEVSSEADKKEVIQMLYTIDFLQTTREDFTEQYTKQNPNASYDYEQLKYEMKPAALMTITKYFYRNLARLINSEEVSLQDVYFLLNVYETDLNAHMSYSSEDNLAYNSEFMDAYVELQNEFFMALADSSSISFDELVYGFATYSGAIINGDVISRNCSLDFLDEDEKQFLFDEILTYNLWAVSYNVRAAK